MRRYQPPISKYAPETKSRWRALFSRKPKRTIPRERIIRDYYAPQRQSFGNRWVAVTIGIIAALLCFQALFRVPLFQITIVDIRGLRYIDPVEVRSFVDQELHKRRWMIFRNDNYFLLSTRKTAQRIENKFYVIVEKIDKRFPHALIVVVKERVTNFALQEPEGYYALDLQGNRGGLIPTPTTTKTIIADERSDKNMPIPIDYLEKATSIQEAWGSQLTGISIDRFHIIDDAGVMILSTNKQYQVKLDPAKDIRLQLSRFAEYLRDSSSVQPTNYIDLRFDEKLFIK